MRELSLSVWGDTGTKTQISGHLIYAIPKTLRINAQNNLFSSISRGSISSREAAGAQDVTDCTKEGSRDDVRELYAESHVQLFHEIGESEKRNVSF